MDGGWVGLSGGLIWEFFMLFWVWSCIYYCHKYWYFWFCTGISFTEAERSAFPSLENPWLSCSPCPCLDTGPVGTGDVPAPFSLHKLHSWEMCNFQFTVSLSGNVAQPSLSVTVPVLYSFLDKQRVCHLFLTSLSVMIKLSGLQVNSPPFWQTLNLPHKLSDHYTHPIREVFHLQSALCAGHQHKNYAIATSTELLPPP